MCGAQGIGVQAFRGSGVRCSVHPFARSLSHLFIWLAFLCLLLIAPVGGLAESLGRTNPNHGPFPDSSLADFGFLLDAPAGKHGFLRAERGRFAWPNGQRAKFWGVNISNRSVFVGRAEIDRVVEALARAGTNMVRFEALDSLGGLLDIPGSDTSRVIDPAKLEILDYWTAKLRARGIYYYFDLLDFRQFKAGDEVPAYDQIGRAARPYAFFDHRLIDLQKEFAQQLLTHRNPQTGLRYVDDPALALVEVCNEHGLFFQADRLDALVEPYSTTFRQQWNRWLLQQYGSRDRIKAAWGRMAEVDVLGEDENPADYSVRLPLFAPPYGGGNDPAVVDVRRASRRLRDGVRFLYEMQRAYFREMKTFLREIGLKVPITGVVSNHIIPDVASVAAELDFTSENFYADHPAFAGADWQGAFYYNNANPLRGSSIYHLAPWLAALRWENKPVVVREWATVWPNRYRAVAIPETAAYCSLQDFDAVLLFGYQTTQQPERLSDFAHQADPTVWGLYALGALVFLRGDIRPASQTATLQYTPDTLFRWPNTIGNPHRLAWIMRLNSRLPSEQAQSKIQNPEPKILPAALVSSTGEIVRRTKEGLLTISTPRAIALCGELPAHKPLTVGGWTLVTPTEIGALMAVSLDGRPLASSRRFVVKMVSRAENTGQRLEPAAPGAPARFHLKAWGRAPIRTLGRFEGKALRLRRGRQTILSLALANGTWELLVRDGRATFACDTPGIRGTLFGQAITTTSAPQTVYIRPGRAVAANLRMR